MRLESQEPIYPFRNVRLCHIMREVQSIGAGMPRVVLASTSDMETGFSRELFLEWCADPRNTIVLTQRAQRRSLADKLTHMAQGGDRVSDFELLLLFLLSIAGIASADAANCEAHSPGGRRTGGALCGEES